MGYGCAPIRDRSVFLPALQTWPVDTALTIETAASLMISISDNTATDLP